MTIGSALPAAIPAGSGPKRYIDVVNGNDTWDGTQPTFGGGSIGPWKTLSKGFTDGAANQTSGRSYEVADGTYSECIRKTIAATLSGNGPMTFYAKNKGNVIWQPLKTKTVGSHGLPTGTVNVSDTTGFAASGAFTVWDTNGKGQIVSYTGVTPTTFTGCTGGTGTIPAGADVAPRINSSTSVQNLQLQNCAYVRILDFIFEGLYQRPSTDNNAVVFLSGTTNNCLFEGNVVRHGYDHGLFGDTTTFACQIRRNRFQDGGSPCAYPLSSQKSAQGTALGAGTYFYKVWGRYECGSFGTDDGSGNDLETNITVVSGDQIIVSWPAIDALHPDRSIPLRVFRNTSSVANGQTCNYYDLPAGTTQFVDNGQAADGTVAYSTSFSNTDHAIYLLGGTSANPHLISDNIIHDWDFGHVVQLYQKADSTIVTNNTITHEAYSNGSTGRHAAAIVIGNDTGVLNETVDNCVIVNNIIATTNQGIFGYAALGQVKSLNQGGGITLPADSSTTFNMTVNSVTNMASFGQLVIGRGDRTAMATIYYDSISGSVLQNCQVIDGFGLTFANSEQIRVMPVTLKTVNANLTLPGDTVTTFTLTLNSTSGMASGGGYVGLGKSGKDNLSLIKYASISGANLNGCTVVHGVGQSYVIGNEARYYTMSGHGNVAHHNIIYNPTFTHERNDAAPPGGIAGAFSAFVPIVDYVSNGGNLKGQDPKFVNDAARDFRLQDDSPAIGAGLEAYTSPIDFNGTTRTVATIGAIAEEAVEEPVVLRTRRFR